MENNMSDIKIIKVNVKPGKALYDYLPDIMEMTDDVVCVVGSFDAAYDWAKRPVDSSPEYFAGKHFEDFVSLPKYAMHTPYIEAVTKRAIKEQHWTIDEVFHGHFSDTIIEIYYNDDYKGRAGFFLKH